MATITLNVPTDLIFEDMFGTDKTKLARLMTQYERGASGFQAIEPRHNVRRRRVNGSHGTTPVTQINTETGVAFTIISRADWDALITGFTGTLATMSLQALPLSALYEKSHDFFDQLSGTNHSGVTGDEASGGRQSGSTRAAKVLADGTGVRKRNLFQNVAANIDTGERITTSFQSAIPGRVLGATGPHDTNTDNDLGVIADGAARVDMTFASSATESSDSVRNTINTAMRAADQDVVAVVEASDRIALHSNTLGPAGSIEIPASPASAPNTELGFGAVGPNQGATVGATGIEDNTTYLFDVSSLGDTPTRIKYSTTQFSVMELSRTEGGDPVCYFVSVGLLADLDNGSPL